VGLLRTFLALLVVGSHLGAFGGATFAVKAFFIISGFYMALVIDTRYCALPIADFYASRLLRLLPTYWAVGLLTIAAELLLVPHGQKFHWLTSPVAHWTALDTFSLPVSIVIYIGLSLTTMLGLDTGLWLGFTKTGGQLSLAPDFSPNATSVMALNPVPQGWSIGLEMLFYLIAPFVVRRSVWVITSLCIFSLAFRVALMAAGFSGEPWSRTLFPSELIYFLLGVLGYRIYLIIPKLRFSPKTEARLAIMVLFIALIYWPIERMLRASLVWDVWNTVPYALIAGGIPFLFKLTRNNALDANVGELSYPIYMCHALVMGLIQWSPLNASPSFGAGWPRYILTIVLVIFTAYLLDRLLVLPLDELRIRFGARLRVKSRFWGKAQVYR